MLFIGRPRKYNSTLNIRVAMGVPSSTGHDDVISMVIKIIGLIISFRGQLKKKDNISHNSHFWVHEKVKISGFATHFF